MPGRVVGTHVSDPDLPMLARALDLERMGPLLALAIEFEPDAGEHLLCAAEILNHKAGRRCSIRYSLQAVDGDGTPTATADIIGKLYRSARRAERVHRHMRDLRASMGDSSSTLHVPDAKALLPELGMAVFDYHEGEDVRAMVTSSVDRRPLERAGSWLAHLHASPPLEGLKVLTLTRQLEKLDGWYAQTVPYLDPTRARRLADTRQALHDLARTTPGYEPAMIHKDYYHAHIIWNGATGAVLDFDQLAVGDPAVDVGHFVAHLEAHAHSTTGDAGASSAMLDPFLRAYETSSNHRVSARLPFYRAQTFIKLAATQAGRKRGDWLRTARALVEHACDVIEPDRPRRAVGQA